MVVIALLLATLLAVLLLAVDVVIGAELVESVKPLWSFCVEFIVSSVVSSTTGAEDFFNFLKNAVKCGKLVIQSLICFQTGKY